MRTQPFPSGDCVIPAPFNKEIRRFKLAINSGCPLRCEYCFLDKDAGEVLSSGLARKALDFVLDSPGNQKKILIYGGEPFLEFRLLRDAVSHARARERALGKSVSISVATSAIATKREHLDWLKDQRVQLAVSLDGDRNSHDRFRRTKNGAGTFDRIRENLDLIFSCLPARNLIALLGVHPDNSKNFSANFESIVSLGFDAVNIEVIHGVPWSKMNVGDFKNNLLDVAAEIVQSLERKRFLFLESTYHEFDSTASLPQKRLCPAYSYLEIFPNGDYSFYPFPFIAGFPDRGRVRVGNAQNGFLPRYRDCVFNADSALCKGCVPEYYTIGELRQGGEAYDLRAHVSAAIVREIRTLYKNTDDLKNYLKEVSWRENSGFSQ